MDVVRKGFVDGAIRGATMGAAYSAIYAACAYTVDRVAALAPEPLANEAAAAMRLMTSTATAGLATAAASIVYMAVWARYRAAGWDQREGLLVAGCGVVSYVCTVVVLFAARAVAFAVDASVESVIAARPPIAAPIVVPVAIFSVGFGRARVRYEHM